MERPVTVYTRFDAATRDLSAYAVFKGAEPVGRVVFKRSGQRVFCYLQVWGSTMVSAYVNGCGYDRDTASFCKAARALAEPEHPEPPEIEAVAAFKAVKDEGYSWKRGLEDAGYLVQHVID